MGDGSNVVFESFHAVVNAGCAISADFHFCELCPTDPHFQLHGLHVGQLHQGFSGCGDLIRRGIFLNDGSIKWCAYGASCYLFVEEGAFGVNPLELCSHSTALSVVAVSYTHLTLPTNREV